MRRPVQTLRAYPDCVLGSIFDKSNLLIAKVVDPIKVGEPV